MKLITLLNKHFDTDLNEYEDENGVNHPAIWVYEKGEDCEPVVEQPEIWKIGNVYSALTHNALLSETELKALVKAGKVMK
ncbi:hypothetical protein DQR43_22915 [Salmonella enterica subsp. enterica serovar Indiana]|nr:hypothetical protein [Salmonella enterica subsp. enterica serovar Indiana]